MTQATTQTPTSDSAPAVPTAEQIEAYKAKLATKYDGVTDRQLLELIAHQSEYMASKIKELEAILPALQGLANGGLLSKMFGRQG